MPQPTSSHSQDSSVNLSVGSEPWAAMDIEMMFQPPQDLGSLEFGTATDPLETHSMSTSTPMTSLLSTEEPTTEEPESEEPESEEPDLGESVPDIDYE